ncbi:cell division protein FtsX [Polaribacter dokdonensis]|uniref:Cell division protein FtsX n=1 Tax=Polaribacter dokdonensis DSW-5 TaxID=1300348 RepID=A0A0M9CFG2_9FLAO|nr:permease-like cell division protein FtsX [Polaribacter dokdonensis]KOY51452.1 Cell division protein FtsX [Polaribacter dokdonensis DSW-5]SEE11046.1 cell division protein FtsX [Polaribacter dokdonensis DSW-5]
MSKKFDSYQKRRLQSSYISVVISIALVLFMVGILSLIVLKSTKVANYVKEKVAITLFIKDNVTQKQIKTFRESLLEEEFTKKAIYTSKAQAAKRFSEQIGEDFLEFLGENPLKNGVDIYLKADYVTPEKVAELEQRFQKNAFVADVSYDKPLINLLTKNIKRISFWLLVLSSFFALVAMILINSSIRLSIYSKRFNIKTMQMVGATKSFIRRPFIFRSLKLGLLGALIALMGIAVIIYYLDKYIPAINFLEDYITLGYISGIVIISSLIITWISTFLATQRFLNLQTDELYY